VPTQPHDPNPHPNPPRWAVNIKIGRSSVYVGTYADEVEAARAWDCAAIAVRGIDTRTNFPVENYSQGEVGGMALLLHERQPHLSYHWDSKGRVAMGARRAATGRGCLPSDWEGATTLYAAWWRGQSGAAAAKRGALTAGDKRRRSRMGSLAGGDGAYDAPGDAGGGGGGFGTFGPMDGLALAADGQLAPARLPLGFPLSDPAAAALLAPGAAAALPLLLPAAPGGLSQLLPMLSMQQLQQLAAAAAGAPGDAQAALTSVMAAVAAAAAPTVCPLPLPAGLCVSEQQLHAAAAGGGPHSPPSKRVRVDADGLPSPGAGPLQAA
jgi:hypothetical protein